MAERLSKFFKEFRRTKEAENELHFEVGSAVLANLKHPTHSEDRVVAKILAGGSLAFVAAIDGVGSGGRDSEIAAEIVRKKFDLLEKLSVHTFTQIDATRTLATLLLDAADQLRIVQREKNNKKMDATVTAGLIIPHENKKKKVLLTANVGDSRIYRFNGERQVLTQITKDDTLVQALVDYKILSEEAAFVDPRRNQILKRVSLINGLQDISFTVQELHPNDTIVATTDGLTDNIPPAELSHKLYESIQHATTESKRVQWHRAAERLAGYARQIQMEKKHPYAKDDDISVVLLHLINASQKRQ